MSEARPFVRPLLEHEEEEPLPSGVTRPYTAAEKIIRRACAAHAAAVREWGITNRSTSVAHAGTRRLGSAHARCSPLVEAAALLKQERPRVDFRRRAPAVWALKTTASHHYSSSISTEATVSSQGRERCGHTPGGEPSPDPEPMNQ